MEAACASPAVSKVLDDDDLLVEILLRVVFPTTLVRAALVCKRWFHCASDRAFLRRFRKLHPPRLLGYYRDDRFVPLLPQPPELAAVVRRVESYSFGGADDSVIVKDCRNGSVYTILYKGGSGFTAGVHSPLCPDRAVAIVPPLSHPEHFSFVSQILSREEEGGGLSYVYVSPGIHSFTVYMLQDGVWSMHTSATIEHPTLSLLQAVLVDNKIYMIFSIKRDIIVLDLTTSSISRIKIPQGVESASLDSMLSRADDGSGVYLIQVDLELRIWIHRGDNWLLVDTVCFREMVANLRMSDCTDIDEHTCDVQIIQVGDNAEFVFLEMGGFTLYLDIKCRTLRKVHERTELYPFLEEIYPFMMIWPPTFPTPKSDFARNTT